jgi:hypothetical protein
LKQIFICVLFLILLYNSAFAAILVLSSDGTYITKPDLSTAATAAEFAGKTIVVTSALSAVQSNISSATVHAWPSDRVLKFDSGGSIANTTGFTINSNLVAGFSQIFKGTGLITFASGVVDKVFPEWWGITGTGDQVAINKALTAVSGKGIPVQLLGKTYSTTDAISPPEEATLQGVSGRYAGSKINFSYTGSNSAINIVDGQSQTTIQNLIITGGGSGCIGISVRRPETHLDNIRIRDFTGDAGIIFSSDGSASGPWFSKATRIAIEASTDGIPAHHPLKWGIQFGTGANSITLDKFLVAFSGTPGTGAILVESGAHINISNGAMEANVAGTCYTAKVTGGENISFRDIYVEGNSNGFYIYGNTASAINNVTIDNVFFNGTDSQQSGIVVEQTGRGVVNGVTLTNNYISRMGSTGTDMQILGYPSNVWIANNTLMRDAEPTIQHKELPKLSILHNGVMKGRIAVQGFSPKLQAKTADYPIALDELGGVFTNTGATNSVTFTLPPASVGSEITIDKTQVSETIVIAAYSGQTIQGAATLTNSTNEIASVKLRMSVTDTWIIVAVKGTWS